MERRASRPSATAQEKSRDKERMATEFKLPELGENIESGDLVRLMIKPGANIAEGEPVMELETDKAVVEVPSSVTGTIGEIRVKEGDKLRVGQVIFTVENGTGAGATPAPKVATAPADCSSRSGNSRSPDSRSPSADGSAAAPHPQLSPHLGQTGEPNLAVAARQRIQAA